MVSGLGAQCWCLPAHGMTLRGLLGAQVKTGGRTENPKSALLALKMEFKCSHVFSTIGTGGCQAPV